MTSVTLSRAEQDQFMTAVQAGNREPTPEERHVSGVDAMLRNLVGGAPTLVVI